MPTDKQPTSFRLSDEARELIARLAATHGVTATAVLEMAVRHLARRDLRQGGGKQRKTKEAE